ncbi:MAG: S8 family serine peptidase [Caldilineaceae bacterium]|nr:S8 family serine peptidase [Caldilineaceae bacterium]
MRRIIVLLCALLLVTATNVNPLLAQDDTSSDTVYLPLIVGEGAITNIDDGIADDADFGTLDLTVDQALTHPDLASSVIIGNRFFPSNFTDEHLGSMRSVTAMTAPTRLEASLLSATGTQQVIVRLAAEPLAVVAAASVNASAAEAQQAVQAQAALLAGQQADVLAAAQVLDGNVQVLGQTRNVLNALLLEINASALAALADNAHVASISRVQDYEMALSETVPYIGARTVQELGYDGSGVTVAVLDSGIDYTHVSMGGAGTIEAYEAAYTDTVATDGLFPTEKVVAGFDFVGEIWPDGRLAPDPDPIDFDGHGTHVADIIGGVQGVAPGVKLHAVKVCSAVSSSCSGVALILAMDYVVDPNADGDFSDAVDIVNMSLGSDYGLAFDDDLSQAVENATRIGVMTVAASGNGGDKPYISGSPAAAPSALSVAQTQVPSAILPVLEIVAPATVAGQYDAIFQPWSAPLTAFIEAPVLYGDGNGGNLDGCAPFEAGSLAGYIVLVDRGSCFFSDKIQHIEAGGGLVGIIGLIAPGEPFQGGFGEGDFPNIPGFMVSQATSNQIKAGLPDTVIRFDPENGQPLIGSVVGSSSRGPDMSFNHIKPEIGAPGASVSAVAGSGDGVEPFGGTSGATPMVSGAAALLMQAYPDRTVPEIKSLLMNTAKTDIINKVSVETVGEIAPITRIGGGEVRVDAALASPAAAWAVDELTGALSFGFEDVSEERVELTKGVLVKNYTDQPLDYTITPMFRDADDEANGAVTVETPATINVPANGTAEFSVTLHIDAAPLRSWEMNSGSEGANPALLTLYEYDGWIFLQDATSESQIHLAWQVLPREAGSVRLRTHDDYVRVSNIGASSTVVEAYSLIATSPDLPRGAPGDQSPTPDFRYIGYTTVPVPAGFCSDNASFVLSFAVNTWERTTHADAPAAYEFDIDVDQDGNFDYAVYNLDLAGSDLSDGRNVTYVDNLATGESTIFFFTDHDTNSANTVLSLCGEQIGLDATALGQPMNVKAFAVDFYYFDGGTGNSPVTDVSDLLTIAPGGERYVPLFKKGGIGTTVLPEGRSDQLRIVDTGSTTNSSETGILLLYRDGAEIGEEAGVITVTP